MTLYYTVNYDDGIINNYYGGTFNIDDSYLSNYGIINNWGTIDNDGDFINRDTINNYCGGIITGYSIDNRGVINEIGCVCGDGIVTASLGETCELPNTDTCDAKCQIKSPPTTTPTTIPPPGGEIPEFPTTAVPMAIAAAGYILMRRFKRER